jgi:hypothetical protein
MGSDERMENSMDSARKPKGNRTRASKTARDVVPLLANAHAHLIRIPAREAMKRAVMVLGEIRTPYCGFTDSRLLVVTEHVDLLRKEKIPFEELS